MGRLSLSRVAPLAGMTLLWWTTPRVRRRVCRGFATTVSGLPPLTGDSGELRPMFLRLEVQVAECSLRMARESSTIPEGQRDGAWFRDVAMECLAAPSNDGSEVCGWLEGVASAYGVPDEITALFEIEQIRPSGLADHTMAQSM
jgi:hypothetical protein